MKTITKTLLVVVLYGYVLVSNIFKYGVWIGILRFLALIVIFALFTLFYFKLFRKWKEKTKWKLINTIQYISYPVFMLGLFLPKLSIVRLIGLIGIGWSGCGALSGGVNNGA